MTAQEMFEQWWESLPKREYIHEKIKEAAHLKARTAFLAGHAAGVEQAAETVEKLELERFNAVGNPMIHTFTPRFSLAILRLKGVRDE